MSESLSPTYVSIITPKGRQSATSRYRCHHLEQVLQQVRKTTPGFSPFIRTITEPSFPLQSGIVILHRLRYQGEADRVIAAARQTGSVVVASVDDLIFSPEYAYQVGLTSPPDDPTFYGYHRAEADDHLRTLKEADAVLVSTEFLTDEVRAALGDTKPVYCLRNVLNTEMIALADAAYALRSRRLALDSGTITLGYLSGSPTHDVDFAEIASPLARVMTRFPQTRLLLVGTVTLPVALQPFADAGRVRRHPFVPWQDLFGLTAQLDIALAPLDASRLFNHAKSEIKMLEAGAVGVPTVATWTAGVAEVGENIGILARTGDDWETAISSLIERDAVAKGEAARNWVTANSTTNAACERTTTIFCDLAARRSPSKSLGAVVKRPWREQLSEQIREVEAGYMRRSLRLQRHLRLLRAELEKKGL